MFPKSYDEARARFLASSESLKRRYPRAEMRSFNVPSAKDPNLFVDEIYIPGKKALLMLTSGVHGLEASLGSAAQLEFMSETIHLALEKGAGVYIVHCLNPYGWKYARRVTEENINLNRNFGTTPETFRTPNEGYLRLAPEIERNEKARHDLLHPFKTLKFLATRLFKKEFTSRTLTQAIAQGQFTNPRGLEYGGREQTPQARNLTERFKQVQNGYDEIIHIDFHTGLGKRNRLHLLTGFDQEKCVHPETFKRLFRAKDEAHLYKFNSGDEDGFYRTVGDINMMTAECAPGKKVVALTFEFGTLGTGLIANGRALSRLWLENRGTQNGFASKKDEQKIKAKFRDLFEPQDPAWQKNALDITHTVLRQVVERL